MGVQVDDRDMLEPGAGITSGPSPEMPSGATPTDPFAGYSDYFGFDEEEIWYLPDGKQWIKFKKMNEGTRGRFQRATRPEMVFNQRSGEAKVPVDQANERRELILHSVTDWHIVRKSPRGGGLELVPFSAGSGGSLGQWVQSTNPALVAELEKAIRKANPWMLQEMSVDQIDKEIADLQDLRKAAVERQEREERFPIAS